MGPAATDFLFSLNLLSGVPSAFVCAAETVFSAFFSFDFTAGVVVAVADAVAFF